MTTDKATTVAPPQLPAAPRTALTEQLHVLVDVPTREYVLGAAAETAEQAGYKFIRQGETVRELLLAEIVRIHHDDPEAYARRVARGRAILAEPPSGATPRSA